MELPTDFFVKPIPSDEDLFAFQFPIALEGKAFQPIELEDGDLLIEGWAAEFEGEDRENENFMPGAFERGIKTFLSGPASLCFHHKHEKVLGKVLELKEDSTRGLWMKARVDGAIKDHPELGTYYKQIKNGTLSALSIGGFFRRAMTAAGRRISDMDFTEISITPVPSHAKPSFSVVAGKALEETAEAPPVEPDSNLESVEALLEPLEKLVETLEGKAVAPKGDPQDLYFLALILDLEKMSNNISTSEDETSDQPGEDSPTDARVDSLAKEVREALDGYAQQAHKLAAKLGPLPQLSYTS